LFTLEFRKLLNISNVVNVKTLIWIYLNMGCKWSIIIAKYLHLNDHNISQLFYCTINLAIVVIEGRFTETVNF